MDEETAATNTTATKFKATPEGLAVAYLSLMVMSLTPILFGSFRSVKHQKQTNQMVVETGQQAETMTVKDAAFFPVIASCALLGLFICMKLFPDLVNIVLSGYFFMLGVAALYRLLQPIFRKLFVPYSINKTEYCLLFTSRDLSSETGKSSRAKNISTSSSVDEQQNPSSRNSSPVSELTQESIFDYSFTVSDIASFICASLFGLWYILTKHWVANNAFGLAFALSGIELLKLNSIKIGCILLGGLFIYDIFWVFGTTVMVDVAKSFDAPIKLVFPQDFLTKGLFGKQFAMLGLGDIVIPGIFIALLLRFDFSLRPKRKSNVYFWASFLAYILGLAITIGVMTWFKHAQPALLYLVPCCTLIPLTVATFKGDLPELLRYRDHPDQEQSTSSSHQD